MRKSNIAMLKHYGVEELSKSRMKSITGGVALNCEGRACRSHAECASHGTGCACVIPPGQPVGVCVDFNG